MIRKVAAVCALLALVLVLSDSAEAGRRCRRVRHCYSHCYTSCCHNHCQPSCCAPKPCCTDGSCPACQGAPADLPAAEAAPAAEGAKEAPQVEAGKL